MDIYALGHAPYASKNRVKGGCLRPRREVGLGWIPVAEVKREGFYEAVMADKVSLRLHRRLTPLLYPSDCSTIPIRCRILPYFLSERLMPRFILSRLHISFIGTSLVYIAASDIRSPKALRDIRSSLECSFNKYLKRQLIKII